MLDECWSIVYDAGPTLNQHWGKVPLLLGSTSIREYSNASLQVDVHLNKICFKLLHFPRSLSHLNLPPPPKKKQINQNKFSRSDLSDYDLSVQFYHISICITCIIFHFQLYTHDHAVSQELDISYPCTFTAAFSCVQYFQ